jgi:hypothetical protein
LRGDQVYAVPAGGAGITGTSVISFGATPTDEATATVTTSGLSATDHINAFTMRDTTTGGSDVANGVDEHEMLAVFGRWSCIYVSATEFTATCNLIGGLAIGEFKFRWSQAS